MTTPSQHDDLPVVTHRTDVLIVGGGAAGTMAAFECADAGVAVIQVTKGRATSGTTTVARGGFAAAMGEDDLGIHIRTEQARPRGRRLRAAVAVQLLDHIGHGDALRVEAEGCQRPPQSGQAP